MDKIYKILLFTLALLSVTYGYSQKEVGIGNSSSVAKTVEVNVFPNPTSDFIEINSNQSYKAVDVRNILGKRMAYFDVNESDKYSLRNLPSGVYIVRIMDNVGKPIRVLRIQKN